MLCQGIWTENSHYGGTRTQRAGESGEAGPLVSASGIVGVGVWCAPKIQSRYAAGISPLQSFDLEPDVSAEQVSHVHPTESGLSVLLGRSVA